MNKKLKCFTEKTSNVGKFQCNFCNRCFTTNQTLKIHISKTCPIIKNKKTEDPIIATMQNEIKELKNTVNELKNNMSINTNSNNTINNTINNTTNIENQNITINITPFKETKLLEKYIIDTFLDDSTAASEYTKLGYMEKANSENIHIKNLIKSLFLESIEVSFADDINNVNVYLDEIKKSKKDEDKIKVAKVYQGDHKWLPKSVMSVLRKEYNIFIEKCKKISGKINYPEGTPIGHKNGISESISMLRLMGNNNIIKDAEPDFSIILDANRDRLKNENII